MKLSIVLPTIFPELLPGAVDSAHEAAGDVPHEVVVVSPFDPMRGDVRWVREDVPRGSNAAANIALSAARAPLVALVSDDTRLSPGALPAAIDRLEKIPGGMVGFPRVVGKDAYIGSVFGHYYPYYFIVERATLDRVGYFDDIFLKHFADADLALRVRRGGGRCEFERSALIVDVESRGDVPEAPDKTEATRPIDFARFAERWAAHFDPAWGTSDLGINLDVALDFVELGGGGYSSMDVTDPARILDIRALSALSLIQINHRTLVGSSLAAQALGYLRWLASLDEVPLNVIVGHRNRVMLGKMYLPPGAS